MQQKGVERDDFAPPLNVQFRVSMILGFAKIEINRGPSETRRSLRV
jgi:hypothetical protein